MDDMAAKTVRQLVVCQICYETLVSPRALPCLHTFCERCLRVYVDRTLLSPDWDGGRLKRLHFDCPACRRCTRLPRDGVGAFPTNHILMSLSDALSSTTAAAGETRGREANGGRSRVVSPEADDGRRRCRLSPPDGANRSSSPVTDGSNGDRSPVTDGSNGDRSPDPDGSNVARSPVTDSTSRRTLAAKLKSKLSVHLARRRRSVSPVESPPVESPTVESPPVWPSPIVSMYW